MAHPPAPKAKETETDDAALQSLLAEAGITNELATEMEKPFEYRADTPQSWTSWTQRQWITAAIAGGFASFNIIALLSLYPVLRGRGAPYLPTKRTNLDRMFAHLRATKEFRELESEASATGCSRKERPSFVDLGSGDGRVVFRAAREGLFRTCTGYEINPMLHGYAQTRRLLTPKYWNSTQFRMGDIWKVDLTSVDVVAVYGLSPMMKDLGVKLKQELKPGSYVLSNVFAIPDWKPIASPQGTHIYRTPECWLPSNAPYTKSKLG